jgi:glutamyl-Q tRNA(Asp) synthetase
LTYRGRFAPTPTGLLHAGSLVAALASWLDARAHGGVWLVRIEDVDHPRCVPGADQKILAQLAAFGMLPDEPPVWQSNRSALYETALAQLNAQGWVYRCSCTRRQIQEALVQQGMSPARHAIGVYPGTCRPSLVRKTAGFAAHATHAAHAMRLLTTPSPQITNQHLNLQWHDRRLGAQQQNVSTEVGDFVLKRADAWWAYQLAVVVDDAAQAITHVVRGADLADNTPRQIHLQHTLGLPTPRYLHIPLVLGVDGQKLSKQNGATPLDVSKPSLTLLALKQAGRALDLHIHAHDTNHWLALAIEQWRVQWLS